MPDFTGGMFDFNGNGKLGAGEEFMAFKSFESYKSNGSSQFPVRRGRSLDGYEIFMIVLIVYAILNALCG